MSLRISTVALLFYIVPTACLTVAGEAKVASSEEVMCLRDYVCTLWQPRPKDSICPWAWDRLAQGCAEADAQLDPAGALFRMQILDHPDQPSRILLSESMPAGKRQQRPSDSSVLCLSLCQELHEPFSLQQAMEWCKRHDNTRLPEDIQALWDRGDTEAAGRKFNNEWSRHMDDLEKSLIENGMSGMHKCVATVVRTSFPSKGLAQAVLIERFTVRDTSGKTCQVLTCAEYRLLATPKSKSPFTWKYVGGKAVPIASVDPSGDPSRSNPEHSNSGNSIRNSRKEPALGRNGMP